MSDICRAIYWLWTYGGYSGDLSPKSALELLTADKNAVLIDVRAEASYGQFVWLFLFKAGETFI